MKRKVLPKKKLFIDGEWREGQDRAFFEVRDPATNAVIANAARASIGDVDLAVRAARTAFEKGGWSRTSPYVRAKVLLRISDMLRKNQKKLAEIEALNGGKPIEQAEAEIHSAADEFEYYAGGAVRIFGYTFPPHPRALAYTLREPVGVCALIVPWNFPLFLAAVKIAPALACGNSVIVKPASYTPLTTLALAEICQEVGIPDGVMNVITGPGEVVGSHLASHPDVDKIAFTGETATGKKIARLAADTVKRVSLELGGKSPSIVFKDAPFETALASVTHSILGNAGQNCVSTTRVFVERPLFDKFVSAFTDHAKRLKVGIPLEKGVQMGPLISKTQKERVAAYVKAGVEEKAELVYGGKSPGDPRLSNGNFFLPTVFVGNNNMKIAREEIFGPVGVFIPFKTEDEAVRMANDSIYGLAASVWTQRMDLGHRVAARLRVGKVWVNWIGSLPGLPQGGYKQSGVGREDCLETIDLYTELKAVAVGTEPVR